jgi:hypothetical protein
LIGNVPVDIENLLETDCEDLVEEEWWIFSWGALERISEEIFCDFMGIRIFGDAYLCAFMYLASPNSEVTDLESYPALNDRAKYISYARRRFGVRTLQLQVPAPYSRWFSEPPEPSKDEQDGDGPLNYSVEERYLLGEIHKAARRLLPNLLDLVRKECETAGLPLPDAWHAKEVYKRFCSRVPAERTRRRGMGDIINGGWMAFLDAQLWRGSDRKFENINQLVFKSLEVMEFEERTNASKG